MDNGLNPRDNDKVEAGDETAEAHVNNNEWGTNVSSDGLISNRQFIAGCTALVNRCHERPWVNVSKYEFVEKVGKSKTSNLQVARSYQISIFSRLSYAALVFRTTPC